MDPSKQPDIKSSQGTLSIAKDSLKKTFERFKFSQSDDYKVSQIHIGSVIK